MITCLRLFWEFFKVGLFTFGGGYGAIPIIRDAVLSNPWMGVDEELFSYILGVSESTPGPIMVNSATYIGSTTAGLLGSFFATLGVVTPSFIIILLIARFLHGFMEKRVVRNAMDAIKPCVVGIILATGSYLILSGLLPEINRVLTEGVGSYLIPDWKTVLLFGLVFLMRLIYRVLKKKTISPILSIAIAAGFGLIVYGV